jgi:competence protein ComEC
LSTPAELTVEQKPVRIQPQPLVLVALSVCAGIVFDRFVDCGVLPYVLLGLTCVACCFFSLRRFRYQISCAFLLLAWSCIAGLWHHSQWNWYPDDDLQSFTEADSVLACLKVKLVSEPRMVAAKVEDVLNPVPSSARTRILTQVHSIRDGQSWRPATGFAELIVHANCPDLRSGEEVTVYGRLIGSDSTRNPGQFDFRVFNRSKRRLARIHVYRTEGVVRESQSKRLWGLAHVKSSLRKQLNRLTWKHVDPERAGLASAILLGNREQLTSDRRDLFLTTGTVHLLAISGLHIGILAGLFFLLYRVGLIRRPTALLCTIVFVILYAWLVEFRPPVLRAAILIVLFCSARLMGRGGLSYNLLAMAGLIVLAINPMDLFQIGPQLSFLAVGSLIFCQPYIYPGPETDPLKRLIKNTRPTPVRVSAWFWQQALITCKVSAMTWLVAFPLVALRFHLVVPAALVLNPLVMIPIAVALYSGLGVLVLGWFWPSAADVSGWVCNESLGWIENLIAGGQEIPAGHFWASGPGELAVLFFYLFVVVFAMCPVFRLPGRWLLVSAICWVALAWVLPVWSQSQRSMTREDLSITFIDTGHGGSALIQLPKGQTLVYDSGCFGSADYGLANISAVLWSEQVKHIDALVISHADVDHFNSAVELSRRFSIGVVYLSPMMRQSESGSVKMFLDELERQRIPVRSLVGGQQLLTLSRPVAINVLGPPPQGTAGNDNSDSLVLSVEAFGKRFLFPGDLEEEGLQRLLNMQPRQFDVAMAPHHGSPNSRPVEFASWSAPRQIVISASSQRLNPLSIQQFEAMGFQTWVTGRDGAIRCKVSTEKFEMSNWIHGTISESGYFTDRGFRFN